MKFTNGNKLCYVYACLVVFSCASPRMQQAPPTPLVEVVTVNNNNAFLWVPGEYRFRQGVYVWRPGGYRPIPHGKIGWVEGRHAPVGGRYRYHRGYWR